ALSACCASASARARRRPGPSRFPYTTLFRSQVFELALRVRERALELGALPLERSEPGALIEQRLASRDDLLLRDEACSGELRVRSEEHTSELQSRENLVCRLLLEKKKKQGLI